MPMVFLKLDVTNSVIPLCKLAPITYSARIGFFTRQATEENTLISTLSRVMASVMPALTTFIDMSTSLTSSEHGLIRLKPGVSSRLNLPNLYTSPTEVIQTLTFGGLQLVHVALAAATCAQVRAAQHTLSTCMLDHLYTGFLVFPISVPRDIGEGVAHGGYPKSLWLEDGDSTFMGFLFECLSFLLIEQVLSNSSYGICQPAMALQFYLFDCTHATFVTYHSINNIMDLLDYSAYQKGQKNEQRGATSILSIFCFTSARLGTIMVSIQSQYNLIANMRGSKSQAQLKDRPDRSRSFRCLYSNDEVFNTKDINSIFHSPFKDGRRNKEYINPTFISSTIFYPADYLQQEHSDKSPRKNIVYNKNQIVKKELYDKRINQEDLKTNKAHEAVAKFNRTLLLQDENKQNPSRSRSRVRAEKNEQLLWELECLIKHRDNNDRKERERSRRIQDSRGLTDITASNLQTEVPTPIYLQKNRKEMDERVREDNKRNLQEWMHISQQIRKMKDSHRKETKKKDSEGSKNYVEFNNTRNKVREQETKRDAGLLANILKEQIKQCKEKQSKQRQGRFHF